ncbi:MAG TPA: tetratricopeptide repeat protein [Pyrinomonadaceae bacterium]|nr:tetratricopeptide repeat protein [Pyrinomonadaceae bacterium]
MENLKLLFLVYLRPAFAMSEIMDRASWVFAAGAVLIVSMLFFATVNARLNEAYSIQSFNDFVARNNSHVDDDSPEATAAYDKASADYQTAMNQRPRVPVMGDTFFQFFSFEPTKFYQPLLLLALFYVPGSILLMSLFGGVGNFGIILRRDYGALAVCTLIAWAGANLPFGLVGLVLYSLPLSPQLLFALWAGSGLLFGFFMVFALRTVFGANYGVAILTVCLAWLSLSGGTYILRYAAPWLLSPFLLFWVVILFGGVLLASARGFGNAFRQRQNFKRFLHNATVNPRDADAHVQLGLIYLERRQESRALEHLQKAFEIDPNEIDANYELGKIARRKGDLQKAIEHFSVVVEQNDKHSLSEVWREIGATYLEAGMLGEAREALEKFVDRRSFDPEGLYYLGKVLKQQGEHERAREIFEQAVESGKTSPEFRRRSDVRLWSKLAKKEL